jgi:molybdopterin-guanine dinucleotide biosynthesis protein B
VIPVVSIVGKSNVGKTTLLEKLIRELKSRDYRVATIKHHTHEFDMDKPGKDTWRHARAGSDVVVLASPTKLALIKRLDQEMNLDSIAAMAPDVDIILTEGYKSGSKPKIEVSRKERSTELISDEDDLIAVATDHPLESDVPQFSLDDAEGIVNLLERSFLNQQGRCCPAG